MPMKLGKPKDPTINITQHYLTKTKQEIVQIMREDSHSNGDIYNAPSPVAEQRIAKVQRENIGVFHKQLANLDKAKWQAKVTKATSQLTADPSAPSGCTFLLHKVTHEYIRGQPAIGGTSTTQANAASAPPPSPPASLPADAATLGAPPVAN